MEDATNHTNFGFFSGASNVDARNSNFSYVEGNQTNIHVATLNETAYLDKLPRSKEAGFSSKPHRTCLDGTRKDVLEDIEAWEADEIDKFIYWLRGVAGCGKSTIAQTFAERSAKNGRLGASFFCSRDVPDRRNLKLIFPTLAHDLADRFPRFKTALAKIVHSNPNVEHDGLTFQLEKLLVRPLKETGLSCTIVVDALDECEDNEPVSAFLSALAEYVDEIPTIKFFITGRPEDRIRYGFMGLRTKELPLHDVESATVDSDIKLYVKTELEKIARRRRDCVSGSWPSDKDIAMILERSSGLFIIASVIIRFVDYRQASPQTRLKRILDMPHSTIYEGKTGIDVMYHQVLEASFIDIDEDDDEYFDQLHHVVGSIVLTLKPLSCASLTKLLKTTSERIYSILSCLHSVLIVPESDSEAIRMCHKTFADFITDPKRCRDARYHIDAHTQHLKLGSRCLELMNTTLTKNICNLPRYSTNKDIEDLPARRRQYIGVPLVYACSSWAKHLWSSSSRTGDDIVGIIDLVNDLLQKHFLSWLEVLSIEDNLQVSIYALRDVILWLTDAKSDASRLFDLINDCERFVLRFFDVIEHSAIHVYHSALPWTPVSSVIRRLYQKELMIEARLLNAADPNWPACIRTISVENATYGVTFSHDGALIAVCGRFGARILDTMTGVRRATFDEPGLACSAAFSPDDSLVVFGLAEGTVSVWDLQTGNLVQMFEGHTDDVQSIKFSPCGTMVASGSWDQTVRVWSMSSGCCECVLEGHSASVRAVCWSATGDQVISGSDDRTVRVWEMSNGTCSKILGEHSGRVTAVASSHFYFLAALGHTVEVYDSRSFDVIHTISSGDWITSVRFSTDEEKIMYTNRERGLIMDLSKKMQVSSIAYDGGFPVFSPDGSCIASVEYKCVRIWRQSESGHQHEGASVHRNSAEVEDVVFSPDGRVVASTHKSCIKFWDTTTGTCLFTSEDVAGSSRWYHGQKTVVISPNSAFAACQSVKRIWIFDINTRTLVKAFKMNHDADAIAVSSDGRRFISLRSENKSLTLRDLGNDECLASLRYTPPYTNSDKLRIVFAPDGNSLFVDDHVNIHCLRICPASSSQRNRFISPPMDFILVPPECEWSHRDGSLPSSPYRYEAGSCWIMDHDGRHIFWLPPDKRDVWSVGYHEKKIALGTRDGKVYIFDFSNILLS